MMASISFTCLIIFGSFSGAIAATPYFVSIPSATTYAQVGTDVLLNWTYAHNIAPLYRKWFLVTEGNVQVGKSILIKSENDPVLIKNSAYEGRVEFRENGGMVVKNVSLNDEGYIAFSVDFKDGESLNGRTMLNVTINPSVSSSLPREVIAVEGRSSTLQCAFEARPVPVIKWYSYKVLLVNGSRFHIQSSIIGYQNNLTTVRSTLTINNVIQSDTGNITCAAAIPFGQISSSSYFLVHYTPTNVSFMSNKLRNIAVVGQDVLFICKASALPIARFLIYRDNMLISNSTNQTFMIRNVAVSNEGTYRCQSTNYLGSGNSTELNLTVHVPPMLYSHSNDVTSVVQNTSAVLSCIFYGEPAPTISWHRFDGSSPLAIMSSSRVVAVNSSFSIIESNVTFKSVRSADHGNYRCKAVNIVGSNEKNMTLNVTFPPEFVQSIPDRSLIPLGTSNYTVACKVISNPQAQIQWYINGTMFVPSKTVSLSTTEIKAENHTKIISVLTIGMIEKHHFSNYSCTASNFLGSISSKMLLIVTYKPEIILSPRSKIIVNGTSRVSMTCEFESNPLGTFYWNRKLSTNSNFSPFTNFSVTKLHSSPQFYRYRSGFDLASASRSHSGIYTCGSNNSLGFAVMNTTLIVNFAPENVTYLPENHTRVNGSGSLELVCTLEANPEVKIIWLYNDSTPNSEYFNISETVISTSIYEVRKRSILRIEMVEEKLQGVYKCIAMNHQGSVSQQTQLVVQYKPVLLSTLSSNVVKNRHQNTSMHCKVRSNPTAPIVWYKDNLKVIADGRVIVMNKNVSQDQYHSIIESTLQINQLTKRDSGNYSCSATNSIGSVADHAKIVVHYAPVLIPSFGASENITEASSPYAFSCLVEANPMPIIQWYYNGELSSGNITVKVLASNETMSIVESSLKFQNGIKRNNNGTYKCNVTNSIGSDARTVKVNVWYGPEFLSNLNGTINVTTLSNVSFKCKAEGHPAPILRWFKSNTPMSNVPVRSFAVSDTKMIVESVLNVSNASKNDTAEYKCEVTNIVGMKRQTVNLNVLYGPVFPVVTPNVTANLSQRVDLNCYVDANPPVAMYKWTKDGILQAETGPVLRIPSALEESTGVYACSPVYPLGPKRNVTFNLHVQVPAIIKKMTCTSTAKQLQCLCIGHGIPTPKIFWTKDNQTIILATGQTYNLTYQKRNYGRYHCHVKNKLAEAIETYNVFVFDESVLPWTSWGACNVSCGVGYQVRTRQCNPKSTPCTEHLSEVKACNGTCITTPNATATTTPFVRPQAQTSKQDETWTIVLYVLIPVLAVLCIILLVWLANSRGCRREEKEFIVPLNNSLSQPPSIRSMPTRRGIYLPDNNFGVLNSGYRPDDNEVIPVKNPHTYDSIEVEMQFGNEGSESLTETASHTRNGIGDHEGVPMENGINKGQDSLTFYDSAYTHL